MSRRADKARQTAEIDRLRAEFTALRAAPRSPEQLRQVRAAHAALDAAVVERDGKPTTAGYASRAGKRQKAERDAMYRR